MNRMCCGWMRRVWVFVGLVVVVLLVWSAVWGQQEITNDNADLKTGNNSGNTQQQSTLQEEPTGVIEEEAAAEG